LDQRIAAAQDLDSTFIKKDVLHFEVGAEPLDLGTPLPEELSRRYIRMYKSVVALHSQMGCKSPPREISVDYGFGAKVVSEHISCPFIE